MAARVEVKISEWFNVLNHITWRKHDGSYNEGGLWNRSDKEILRRYFEQKEEIIFAEHYGADSVAKGESGYGAQYDELRGFVFEPLRAYLDGERLRANISQRQVISYLGMTGHDPHFFKSIQWKLPLEQQYELIQKLFNQQGRHPAPPYEDYHDIPRSRFERNHDEREYLRAEYEDLRAEYEDLRRPFNVTIRDQYTDVWDFPTVKAYPGKHPTEKPLEMMEHMVRVSSKSGDLVTDFFCGSGTTAEAAMRLDRRYFCCDIMKHWANYSRRRVEIARLEMSQLEMWPL